MGSDRNQGPRRTLPPHDNATGQARPARAYSADPEPSLDEAPGGESAGADTGFGTSSGAGEPQTQEGSGKKKRRLALWVALTIIGVLVVGGIILVALLAARLNGALDQVKRDDMLPAPSSTAATNPDEQGAAPENPPLNVVLMGSDAREDVEGGRSDSLMVFHVSGDRKSAYLVSIPRDLWVDIPGHKKAKINAAYAWGGPKLTVQTVNQLLGIQADHAVLIDFKGFVKLVDAVGGITVYNPWPSNQDEGFVFPKGELTLNGDEALVYSRERYQLPDGDLSRAQRQRDVIKAILKKVATPEVLGNPKKLDNTMAIMASSMTVDNNLTNAKMIDLATGMRMTNPDDIVSLQLPFAGFGRSQDGQSIDVLDEAAAKELGQALRSDKMTEYAAKHKR